MTVRQSWFQVWRSVLIGGAATVILVALSEVPSVNWVFFRLAWRLGPWHSLPSIYDRSYFGEFESEFNVPTIGLILAFYALCLAAVIIFLHSSMFYLAVLLHRWFGWPQYWRDIRSAVDLRTCWAASARRSWWIWPSGMVIWHAWKGLGWGFSYAMYPIIGHDGWYPATVVVPMAIGYAAISSMELRRAVAAAVGTEGHRCDRCNYPLRGLTLPRCPECGQSASWELPADFRLRWERTPARRAASRGVLVLLFCLFLSAPGWVPLAWTKMPWQFMRYIPYRWHPRYELLLNPNAFPLRPDAVYFIRHEGALGLIAFRTDESAWTYRGAYWPQEEEADLILPRPIDFGPVQANGNDRVMIGPWHLTLAGSGEVIWLYRPDVSYEIRGFEAGAIAHGLLEPWEPSGPANPAPGHDAHSPSLR